MKQIHNENGFLENSPDSFDKEVRRRFVKSGNYMARLVQALEESLNELGVRTQGDSERHIQTQRMIEQMAMIIHDSMSASTRNYHSVQHVFDVAEGVADDPIAILAALFHDCVYYHVDGGISDLQWEHLKVYGDTFAKGDELPEYRVKGDPGSSDVLLRMVECIFGYPVNAVVTYRNGLNEFLSAVLCVRQLEPLLSLRTLAEIACCIEMTIPFRPDVTDQHGNVLSCSDRLFLQMLVTSKHFDLGMKDDDIVKAVQRAVRVSNEGMHELRSPLPHFRHCTHILFSFFAIHKMLRTLVPKTCCRF